MADNNLKIKVQADLDGTKSRDNIANSVKKLENTPFFIRLIAKLNKALSKANINNDVKSIEKNPPAVHINGRLNRSATRRNIRADVRNIGNETDITINAHVDERGLEQSLETAVNNAENNIRNNPINIPANINGNINENTQQIQNLNNEVRNSRSIFNEYLTARDIFRLVANSIKEVIGKIAELNKAQTDLQIATSKSADEIKSLMRDYNQIAKDMSSTTLETSDAADSWLRQGQSVADTNMLIKDSLILSKIGQIESAQATEYLTSGMKGFKVEAKDAIKIVDKLSAVDLQSASSAGGLAEAMSKCANSADTAGISMDALIGYIATVAEVTQKSDSVIGESFKTIIARMGKIKLNDWIDEDGNDISGQINDVEKTLGRFDIALRKSATEFRDFEDVIYDVGMAWEKFSSVDKNAIANAFGGVYQRENVITLFNNFSRALELTEASANSAGTAMEKFSIYENSLEAATNRLTASFEGLAYNALDSDFLAGLATATAGVVEFVDSTQLLKTGLTAALFTGAIAGLTALGTRMIAVRNNVIQFSQAMNLSSSSSALSETQYRLLLNSVNGLTEAQLRLVLSSRQLTEAQRLELMQSAGIEQARQRQLLQTWRLTEATNAQRTATFSLRGAWAGLKASIATNPIGLIVTALTTATMAISAHNQAQEEAMRKMKETAEKISEESKALDQLKQKYIKICDSADDEVTKNQQLNEIKQELVDTYGFEKEAIEQLNLEREKGLNLLDSEIEKTNRIARNDWLKNNETAVNKANLTLGNTLTGNSVYSNTTNNGGISDAILNLFENKYISDGFVRLSFNMDDVVDGLNKTKDIYNEILEIQSRRNLTEDELSLLNKVKSDLDYLQELYDKYYEVYSTAAKYNVQNLVENYLETDEGKLESVGKKTFKSWSNGLIKQAENAEQKRQIQKYIEDIFPDLTKYFNNLETAKKMFIGGANPNSEYTARIKNYLESLSDEDLEIATKIPKLFADGLAGATAKIDAWKKDPNNVIKPTVDTKPLEEMAGEVSSKVKLIVSAMEDMEDTGHISSSTYAEIIEMGGNYVECLELQNGQLTLNIGKLKELETQEYKNAISANNLAIAEMQMGINSAYDYQRIKEKVDVLKEQNALYQILIDEIYGASPKETSSKSSSDPNKEAFDAENDLRKHWIAMGKDKTGKKYTEEMYYAWLDSADGYRYYFSDLEKYQDEYNKYEEEIYKWRLEQDNKLFEQKLENNEKLIKEIKNGEYDDPIQKYDELAKATENSLKLVQARIEELIASGSGAVQDEIDSLKKQAEELQEDLAEIEKDKLKTRVENEKTFWEQQKEAVETYYDNEIKNLEKIEDEQERINKKEELRLNLIKAQKELLDAKKNRNQLLFANGGFYYDYDQEAVQNAQENVTKAQEEITDFNNDETKRLLEEQRDNEIAYYNTIIEMLEAYINKTSPIESSDSEIFNTAMNSKYAQAVLEKKNNITKPETPVTLENVIQNMGIKYNKEVVSAGYDLLGKVMSNSLKMPFGILDAYSKMNAQNYTVNNNNNNSVYIENMPVTVPVGTTEEQVQSMIDQFASGVISTMRAKRAKLQ